MTKKWGGEWLGQDKYKKTKIALVSGQPSSGHKKGKDGFIQYFNSFRVHIQIPPTGYVGLVWRSTAEATAS